MTKHTSGKTDCFPCAYGLGTFNHLSQYGPLILPIVFEEKPQTKLTCLVSKPHTKKKNINDATDEKNHVRSGDFVDLVILNLK